MANGKITYEGAIKVATDYIKARSYYLGLYENPTEPLVTATLIAGDITEAAGAGYSRILLNGASWSVDSTGKATNVQKTFTATGTWSNAVTGSFLTSVASGTGGILDHVQHSPVGDMTVLSGKTVKIIPEIPVAYVP